MPTAREEELSLLFSEARTHFVWRDRAVEPELLRRLYELTRMGPTGGNSQPLRVVFVTTPEARERLRPALAPPNVDKTMSAPVTAIIAHDTEFYRHLAALFPSRPEAADRMRALPAEVRERMVLQSTHLQAGYLILAARALGLDCGPMAGFDPAKVDEAFLAGTTWRSSLLINLGYGDPEKLYPRQPRLSFDDACRVV